VKSQNLFAGLVIILLTYGCSRQKEKELLPGLKITLSGDSTSIQITNVPRHVMEQLRADSLTQTNWRRIMAVYEEGNEVRPVSGLYSLDSLRIIFSPAGGFKKGRTYLAECYIRNQPYNARQMATGRSNLFKPEVYRESFSFSTDK
jgi:hypothetical protein